MPMNSAARYRPAWLRGHYGTWPNWTPLASTISVAASASHAGRSVNCYCLGILNCNADWSRVLRVIMRELPDQWTFQSAATKFKKSSPFIFRGCDRGWLSEHSADPIYGIMRSHDC